MMNTQGITADKLAAVYIKIRDARAALKLKFDTADQALQDQLDAVEAELLDRCKVEGADSIKTPHGTIIRSIRNRYWPADWEAFKQFCLSHETVDLFEKRVHQTNMQQWILDNPDDVPVGLNIDRKYVCTVRRMK